ncbi:MAG: globin domain-containing protein [Sporichthyaceae bacterium]
MERDLIKESFAVVEPQAERVAAYFYARLFLESPELRQLFPPAMDAQRSRLFGAVVQIVQGADQPEFLTAFLNGLGRDHRKFGVKAVHYEALGRALLAAIARYAGPAWTPEVEAAWVASYARVARTMIEAARRAALDTPDWWLAEIVDHELRGPDIAVLRLRPDSPFPYEAGQYCSIETPWWPRVWRSYSMANAPRRDNLIDLHVRKIDAGWVSTALVRRARPGDVVRLGHPTGTMVADRTSNRDLLLLAGGTGLAPMRAIVEDMARWNWYRRVHLFVGGRHFEDNYDLSALYALTRQHEWLTVVPAVSHDPEYPGERGTIVDVALRHGDWANHDVFVSGSAAMVRASIDRLLISGVRLAQIRFDSFGDLR